jgi:hypothetical protein
MNPLLQAWESWNLKASETFEVKNTAPNQWPPVNPSRGNSPCAREQSLAPLSSTMKFIFQLEGNDKRSFYRPQMALRQAQSPLRSEKRILLLMTVSCGEDYLLFSPTQEISQNGFILPTSVILGLIRHHFFFWQY